VKAAYTRVCAFFDELKAIAPQLTHLQGWYRILSEAMKKYLKGVVLKPPNLISYES
jgi:folate-dependent phosphoribosylglycinamide formyltransferase PurN